MAEGKVLQSRAIADLHNQRLYSQLSLGSRFFVDGITVPHFIPSWNGANPLVFMPIGELNEQGEVNPPFDFSSGEPVPSNFYIRLPCVTYMGSVRKVEFPLFDPFDASDGKYDVASNPYIHLRQTIKHMSKQPEYKHWKPLLDKDEDDTVIPNFSEKYFFYALVFQEGRGYVGNAKGLPRGLQQDDRTLAVVSMSGNQGVKLLNLIQEFASPRDGRTPVNLLAGAAGACYIVAANPEKHPAVSYDPAQQAAIAKDLQSATAAADMSQYAASVGTLGSDSGEKEAFKSYDMVALPSVALSVSQRERKVFKPCPWSTSPQWKAMVAQRYRPLGSLFQIPSHREQIKLICSALEDKPEILRAAFPANSEYCTEDVERAISRRPSLKVGALGISDEVRADPLGMLSGQALQARTAMSVDPMAASSSQAAAGSDMLDDLLGLGGPYAKATQALRDA